MKEERFSLEPFSGEGLSDITIAGVVSRHFNTLSIQYELRADMAGIVLPARTEKPARRDMLWKETCFEMFIAPAGSESYREFNFSPSGHWNVYCFNSYRKGMMEDAGFIELPFKVEKNREVLSLSLEIGTEIFMPGSCPLDIGVAAVIRTGKDDNTYWALSHIGSGPDFHRRDSFSVTL